MAKNSFCRCDGGVDRVSSRRRFMEPPRAARWGETGARRPERSTGCFLRPVFFLSFSRQRLARRCWHGPGGAAIIAIRISSFVTSLSRLVRLREAAGFHAPRERPFQPGTRSAGGGRAGGSAAASAPRGQAARSSGAFRGLANAWLRSEATPQWQLFDGKSACS